MPKSPIELSAKSVTKVTQDTQSQIQVEKLKTPWEQDIGDVNLTDDLEFTCYISFFIESSSKYYGLMEMFNEAAESGKRWEIKVISKEYIKKTVLDYCTKSREKKPFNLLCDQILRYAGYDFEGRIPPSLLGYFIKYEIRRLKNAYEDHIDYIKKYEDAREARLKAATKLLEINSKTASKIVNNEEVQDFKGKPKSGNKSKEVLPKQLNKNKLPKFQVNYGKRRPESELTIRSEERKDIRYANDFPTEGPQVYLVISTIYEQLPSELLEIMKIPVVCIVKVGEENIKKRETKKLDYEDYSIIINKGLSGQQVANEDKNHSNPNNSNIQTEKIFVRDTEANNKGVNAEYDKRLLEINKYYYELRAVNKKKFDWHKSHSNKETEVQRFWSGFNKKVRQPNNSHYEETILSKYVPSMEAIDYTKDDWKDQLKNILYNEITYSLFNQCQISFLYKAYTSTTEGHILKPDKLEDPMDMIVYNTTLNNIPNECINVAFIFDCMILQVEEYINKKEQSTHESLEHLKSTSQINERELTFQNKLITLNYAFDIMKQAKECEEPAEVKPEIIIYGDKVNSGSKHIGNYSKLLKENTIKPLKAMYSTLFKEIKVSRKIREKYKKHELKFQNILGIRQQKQLAEILILSRAIENINKSESHDIPVQKENVNMNPDEHDYSDFQGKYLLENELHLPQNKLQSIAGKNKTFFNTIEEMDQDTLLQTIFDLALTHNTFEVMYIPLIDSILYKFYNCPKNKFRTVVMQTPINLRDFLKYSLPNEKEWAQKVLDDLYKESIPKTYETELQMLMEKIESPIKDPAEITPKLFIDNNSFLMYEEEDDHEDKAALKYLRDINYTDTFLSQPSNFEQKSSTKKTVKSPPITDKFLSARGNILKTRSFTNPKTSADFHDYSIFYKEKKTNGQIYDLSPNPRIQFNYRSIDILFRHGTKIRIQYKHKLYGRRTINLELQICNHRLYYSSNIYINSEQSKFLLIHRSGIIISFKEFQREQVYREKFNERTSTSSIGTEEELEDCQINSSPNTRNVLQSSYLLTLTWPSGCILETKCLNEKSFYIKQFYMRKCPISEVLNKEVYRVFLKNNSVVKLLNDNTIEILYATGKKITCSDYEWETDSQGSELRKLLKMKKFTTIQSCGKIYSVNQHGHELYEGIMNAQQTPDFSLDQILVEMENGTLIIFKNDGTQIVEFSDHTRFITEIRLSSGEEFMNEDEDTINEVISMKSVNTSSSSSYTPQTEINYNEYLVILTYTTVEHPHFTTVGFCPQSQITTLKLPKNIIIDIYSDNTYYVKLAQGSGLAIKKDRVVFDKYKNGSLFQHSIIMPNVLKYDIIPDPPIIHFLSVDIHGNELKINTQSEIYYRYSLSEENPFCLNSLINDLRYIVIKRDLSGMEIFPQRKLKTMRKILKKITGSTIQDYWNGPFKDTVMIHPAESKYEDWTMPSTNRYSKKEFDLPSTLGESWAYPFTLYEGRNKRNSNIFLLRIIKTLVINDVHKVVEKALQHYKNLIDDKIDLQNCTCKKKRFWNMINNKKCFKKTGMKLYKKGKVSIKYPGFEFMAYLKDNILFHALRVAKAENSRPEEVKKFKEKRSSIFKKKTPPYFLSPFGIAYFVTNELQERINQRIDKQEYNNAIRILLDKDLKTVTQNDIEDTTDLLIIIKPATFGDEVSLKKVLMAGRELEDSFKNMREVIKYHLRVRNRTSLQTT